MSSDSDSDDDLLLAACCSFTTKRKNRTTANPNNRQHAEESKRSNLLDEMFLEQEERISRRRRMDETIKKEQEGFIPNQDDLILSLDGNDPVGGKDVKEGVGGRDDEMNGFTKSNMPNDDDDSSREEGMGGTKRGDQNVIPIKYDFDDPAYRARIEAIKEKSRKMMLKPHESRRQIQRQIEGLDILDDDDDERDGGGDTVDVYTDEGFQSEMTHGSRRKFQTEEDIERRLAEIAGAHCTLGMRRTLGWKWKENAKDEDEEMCMFFVPFESRSDALTELLALFRKYDCEPKASSLSQDGMKLWKSMRNHVIKPLKKAHEMQILPHMLRRDWKSQLDIPLDVVVWLIRVATTGNVRMFADLGRGACEMACKVFERNMNIVQLSGGDGTKTTAVVASKMIWDMKQLLPMLQSNYGLWMPQVKTDHDKDISCSIAHGKQHEQFEEPSGLRHAIMIWTKAIHWGYVQIPKDREEAKVCMRNAISAILFCGIDPIFHNGHGLLQFQGDLLSLLIQSTYKIIIHDKECTIYHQQNEQLKEFEQWALSSAKWIMDFCQHYSSLQAISDEEDTSGAENQGDWLIMLMILRSWSIINDKDIGVLLLYSKLCYMALERCLGWESKTWDQQVTNIAMKMTQDMINSKNEISSSSSSRNSSLNSIKNNNGETDITTRNVPHRYHVLATAETAFQEIAKPCKSFLTDTSRLLATIWIASVCEQVAMELFNHNIQRVKVSPIYRGFCENDSEASMLHDHLDRICSSLQFVKKSIRIVLGKPFLRRSKELVLLLQCTFDKQRDSVAKWDRTRKSGVRRQSDLSTFFQRKDERINNNDDASSVGSVGGGKNDYGDDDDDDDKSDHS